MSAATEALERGRVRDANRLRADLISVLSRVPENGLIFSCSEVDLIAAALGGYTKLRDLLDPAAAASGEDSRT